MKNAEVIFLDRLRNENTNITIFLLHHLTLNYTDTEGEKKYWRRHFHWGNVLGHPYTIITTCTKLKKSAQVMFALVILYQVTFIRTRTQKPLFGRSTRKLQYTHDSADGRLEIYSIGSCTRVRKILEKRFVETRWRRECHFGWRTSRYACSKPIACFL